MDDLLNINLQDVLKANDITIPGSGGGGLDRIGEDLYSVTLPDGRTVIVDKTGKILNIS